MPDGFRPRLDILPAGQCALWNELGDLPHGFVLYGGTALALRLGHRESVDFDFFAPEAIDPQRLMQTLPLLTGARVVQVEPNTLSAVVDRGGPIKLSFFGVPALPVLAPHDVADGVRVASLLDLAGTKAAVVQVRAEAKDYLDIDALICAGIDLDAILRAGRALYGASFTRLATLKALTFYDDGDLATVPQDVRRRLVAAVAAIDPAAP